MAVGWQSAPMSESDTVQPRRIADAATSLGETELAMEASTSVVWLDHFRTPYAVGARPNSPLVEQLGRPGAARMLWPAARPLSPVRAIVRDPVRGPVTIFGTVTPDAEVEPILRQEGRDWTPIMDVVSSVGEAIASIWRCADGSVFVPFDPDEVIGNFWSERYISILSRSSRRALRRTAMAAYYHARPMVPRPVQISLRRAFARHQLRTEFPRWPVETALHDLFDLLYSVLSRVVGGAIPRIASWPSGFGWALVLTHDVEQAEGLDALGPVLELEREHGVRSSWNFVPNRYEIDPCLVTSLQRQGFEVGVHGFSHDGRDLESLQTWKRRLPDAHDAATRWGAVGFRSAALHRNHEWMADLGFDYDSSCPDTDPFEPQRGGCCTWLPYFNGRVVELPITLPQDHTLFVILRGLGAVSWNDKTEFLRHRGGLALLDTHPDYLVDERIFHAYSLFLDRFAADPTAWKALPCEVSSWWRCRGSSVIQSGPEGWRIVGPAADIGRIEVFDDAV